MQNHVYITHPVVDSYARELGGVDFLGAEAVQAGQAQDVVVCAVCISYDAYLSSVSY
jgi:hypothetical protein